MRDEVYMENDAESLLGKKIAAGIWCSQHNIWDINPHHGAP